MAPEFNMGWRDERQEHFAFEDSQLHPFKFSDREWLVYDNVNLSIFVDDHCNGDCDFCIARMRYENTGNCYQKSKLSKRDYLDRLRRTLELVRPLDPSVSITGGEPTLNSNLPEILDVLEPFQLRKKTITTNGSGLLRTINGSGRLLDRLASFGLVHLNLSRAHFDEGRNERLMKMNGSGLSNRSLEEALMIAMENGIRPRLSCALVQGEIETFSDVNAYIRWAESMNIDNVVFRQLMQYDANKVVPCRASRFCDDKSVSLIPIWKELDSDPRFEFTAQVLGYYYYVEVYKHNAMDVVTEAANLAQIPITKERISKQTQGVPVVYEMVFHPNGSLCGSWREWEDVLVA